MKKTHTGFISLTLAFLICLSAFAFNPFYSEAKATGELNAADVMADGLANSDKLTLNSDSGLKIDGTFLKGVKDKQTVSAILSNFTNTDAIIHSADGVKLENDEIVGTGAIIKLTVSGVVTDSLAIVIFGDTTGNGIVDTTDYITIKKAFCEQTTLSDAFLKAADIDENQIINTTDYISVKSHFLGKYDIFADAPSDEPSDNPSASKVNYALNKPYSLESILGCLSGKEDDGKILTDGNISLVEESGSTVCLAGTGALNSLVINLGQVYNDVCKLVVAGVVIGGNRQYATVTISVSNDGTNYTTVSNYALTPEYITETSVNYNYDLTNTVSAKYVKFDFINENYVLALSEIEIYGGTATGDLPSEDPSSDTSSSEEPSSGESSDTRANYALNKTYYFGGSGSFLPGKEDNGSLVTDGYIPPYEASNQTIAFAGTGTINTITIDLGSVYIDVNEFDICGVTIVGNRQYGTVTIEYSSDGVSYTTLEGYTEKTEEYSDFVSTVKYTLSSDISARFVKFTFVNANYVLTIGEIQVWGGNAPSVNPGDMPSAGGTDRLYIGRTGSIWDDYSNCTNIVFPGASVTGLYLYKIYAEYSPVVDGYVVIDVSPSHCSLNKYVGTNAVGIVFSYSPNSAVGRSFAKEQFSVWTNIRPGDILRPSGIDFNNKTIDATGSIATYDLVTNAYFTVQYGERNIPTTKYNDKTIVALGDSVTANGGWTETVSDRIGTKVINSGVGGDRTIEGIKRFDENVTPYNPDIVLIMYGINDCLHSEFNDNAINNYKNQLRTLYDKATAIGAKVIFMCPNDITVNGSFNDASFAPYGGLPAVYPQFIQAIKDVAAEKGTECIDNYTPSHNSGRPLELLCDSVHPNDEGYAMIANTISNYLLTNQDRICG